MSVMLEMDEYVAAQGFRAIMEILEVSIEMGLKVLADELSEAQYDETLSRIERSIELLENARRIITALGFVAPRETQADLAL